MKRCVGTDFTLSAEEADALQEIMNIAFGKASADLAGLLDIFIVLEIPAVSVLGPEEMRGFVEEELRGFDRVSLTEQHFWGKLSGSAFLAFPAESATELITLMNGTGAAFGDERSIVETETLKEVANILNGACISKIAEELRDVVTYSPPRAAVNKEAGEAVSAISLCHEGMSLVAMRTVFNFEKRSVSGTLFLLVCASSLDWLKTALDGFLGRYA